MTSFLEDLHDIFTDRLLWRGIGELWLTTGIIYVFVYVVAYFGGALR